MIEFTGAIIRKRGAMIAPGSPLIPPAGGIGGQRWAMRVLAGDVRALAGGMRAPAGVVSLLSVGDYWGVELAPSHCPKYRHQESGCQQVSQNRACYPKCPIACPPVMWAKGDYVECYQQHRRKEAYLPRIHVSFLLDAERGAP